jgi:sorbitol/mannitol transport system substrate-binding protein
MKAINPIGRGAVVVLLFLVRSLPLLVVLISAYPAHAGAADSGANSSANVKEVTLSSVEQPPYVGQDLPSNGYASQVATEAFARVGYTVKIEFFPVARAAQLAKSGLVDGQLAIYSNKNNHDSMLLSAPFPGGHLVLLKKIGSKISGAKLGGDMPTLLRSLSNYRVGTVDQITISSEFDEANFLKSDTVDKDIQALDTLMAGRFDLVVIDKLTAGDLMVKERPQYIGQVEVFASVAKNSFHVGFSRASSRAKQLKADFDRGLKMLEADGSLAKIMYVHGLNPRTVQASGRTKITIGTVNSPAMRTLQQLSVEYEKKHPEVDLEWRVLDEKVLRLRLLTDLAISDGQYDVMMIGAYEAPIWAKNKWILPLKNLPPKYDLDDVIKPVRNMLSYEGELYALPFYAESSMTFYRKDLLEKAGLTMPDAPTYDDIKRIAAAINNPQKKISGVCLRGDGGWGANIALLGTMVNSAGGRWFDENWNATIDTPEWKLALQTYKDLLTLYGPPHPEEQDYVKNLALFEGGHCGIWIDATVFAGALQDPNQSTVADKVAFTRAPILITPKGSHWLWAWALAIPGSSKVPTEAQQFIEWATSKEYTELVAKNKGWINAPPGTRTSIYQDPRYRKVAPFADDVLKAIEEANPYDASLKPRPYVGVQFVGIPEFVSIGDKVGQYASDVLSGKLTVDAALKNGQDAATTQMRKSRVLH